MARVLPRYCPRCGAPLVRGSGPCEACGLTLEAMLSQKQTIQFSQDQSLEIDQQVTQHDPFIQQYNEQASIQVPQSRQQNH